MCGWNIWEADLELALGSGLGMVWGAEMILDREPAGQGLHAMPLPTRSYFFKEASDNKFLKYLHFSLAYKSRERIFWRRGEESMGNWWESRGGAFGVLFKQSGKK